ncbi:hypothetical protein [Parachlamydia acanthamoebae]|uniref:Histo-blood group ABO system transferase 1 n=2 Tax=Parachlamydia acanthamoebae TaxID=83552 RepID=F8KUR1_PARAV|nr:hypothetical protein [Parachlamydia acanthamoebae]CCB84976.1 histo-blood group ABO system transferase 1 [Parachlamydia acanthamoebae UV-7]
MLTRSLKILIGLCLLFSHALYAANVGLLVMATGKYVSFVPPLVKSADHFFCKNHKVTYFVFTDGYLEPMPNVVPIFHAKMGWPYDTMMRYHVYDMHRDAFAGQDYLYACDADMLFVGEVGDEILGNRVATRHPGFINRPKSSYTYERNPLSTAYIPQGEGNDYFAGGFYGGTKDEFLNIVHTNAVNIDQDMQNGIIAVWHDESHWNRFCINNPPTVILSPSYCYPQGLRIPFLPKLIALDKNHEEMRKG